MATSSSYTTSWLLIASPVIFTVAKAVYSSSKLESDAHFLLILGVVAIVASVLSKHTWESVAIDCFGVGLVIVSGISPLWLPPVSAEISARALYCAQMMGVDTGPGLNHHILT